MRILLSTMSLMVVVCAVAAAPGSAASPPPFTVPPTDCPAGVPLAPGDIATIAGGGNEFGDGGQALDAAVDVTVGGVAVDASGTVLGSSAPVTLQD